MVRALCARHATRALPRRGVASPRTSPQRSVNILIAESMAAVVRIKRCLDEEPNSAFILSCKRRKTEDGNGDTVETLFKFAGTVKNQVCIGSKSV